MAGEYSKRIDSSIDSNNHNHYSLLTGRFHVLRNRWLHSSNKIKITPFTALSLLSWNMPSAHASWLPDMEIFKKVNETKQSIDETWDIFKLYGKVFEKIYLFFVDFDKNVNHVIENVLTWIYHTLSSWVLWTPEWLINNSWFKSMNHSFIIYSVLITAIIVLYKILINICKNQQLDELKIMKRFAIALSVSVMFPKMFEYSVKLLNKLTQSIISITSSIISDGTHFAISNILLNESFGLNELALLLFLAVYLIMIIPIALKAGFRWFKIISLGCIAPMAMSMWIFDDLRHWHTRWWNSLKNCLLSQLVQATFLLFIGLILFSTPTPETFSALITKLLVIGGGLWYMINPPSFIAVRMDNGANVADMYYKSKNEIISGYKKLGQAEVSKKVLSIVRKYVMKV